MPTVSRNEAARYFGVSRQGLNRARETGAIQYEPDDTVDIAKVARTEWGRKHLAMKDGGGDPPPAAEPEQKIPVRSERLAALIGASPESSSQLDGKLPPILQLDKIQLDKLLQAERIRRMQLENKARTGELVNKMELMGLLEKRIRRDAEAILNWPAQVSAMMAADLGVDDRQMYTVLMKYVKEFMRSRSKTKNEP